MRHGCLCFFLIKKKTRRQRKSQASEYISRINNSNRLLYARSNLSRQTLVTTYIVLRSIHIKLTQRKDYILKSQICIYVSLLSSLCGWEHCASYSFQKISAATKLQLIITRAKLIWHLTTSQNQCNIIFTRKKTVREPPDWQAGTTFSYLTSQLTLAYQ